MNFHNFPFCGAQYVWNTDGIIFFAPPPTLVAFRDRQGVRGCELNFLSILFLKKFFYRVDRKMLKFI